MLVMFNDLDTIMRCAYLAPVQTCKCFNHPSITSPSEQLGVALPAQRVAKTKLANPNSRAVT